MDDQTDWVNRARRISLAGAEAFDAWRIVPRAAVAGYVALIVYIIQWFIGIETFTQTSCDAVILQSLLDRGIGLPEAENVACTVTGVVGGPQTTHTILATTVAGLATAIFGLYTNSGRDWSKSIAPWNFGRSKKDTDSTAQ